MTTVELLQQCGLNKYEAEAYYALLTHGALTGYEVGKNSHVPLSRSYEILERLAEKGLALIQPGEPSRYRAQDPQHFLVHVRLEIEATLGALSMQLTELPSRRATNEFWVLRNRQNILARVQTMIMDAQTTLDLTLPSDCMPVLEDALTQARTRGCLIGQASSENQRTSILLLVCDGQEALVGMVAPADACQAVVSSNVALLSTLEGYFAQQQIMLQTVPHSSQPSNDWIAWEERKQRQLWKSGMQHRVA